MGEYRASITYFQERHFPSDQYGRIALAGEVIRFGEDNIAALVKAETAQQDIEIGVPLSARIYLFWNEEIRGKLEPGRELQLVSLAENGLVEVGKCKIIEEI